MPTQGLGRLLANALVFLLVVSVLSMILNVLMIYFCRLLICVPQVCSLSLSLSLFLSLSLSLKCVSLLLCLRLPPGDLTVGTTGRLPVPSGGNL